MIYSFRKGNGGGSGSGSTDTTKLKAVSSLPQSAETGSVFAVAFAENWGVYDNTPQQSIRIAAGVDNFSVSWNMPSGVWSYFTWSDGTLNVSGGWNWEVGADGKWHPNSSYPEAEQASAVWLENGYIYVTIQPSGVVFNTDQAGMEYTVPAHREIYQADTQSGDTTIYKQYANINDVNSVKSYAEGVNTLASSAYTYADAVNTRLDNFAPTKLSAVDAKPKLSDKGSIFSVVNSADTSVYRALDSAYTGNYEWSEWHSGDYGYKAYRSSTSYNRMALYLTIPYVDGVTKFIWDGSNSCWNTGETGGESWTFVYGDGNTSFTATTQNGKSASGYVDNGYIYVMLSDASDGDYGGDGCQEVGVAEVATSYDNLVTSSDIKKIVKMTAAEYALITPAADTLYVII